LFELGGTSLTIIALASYLQTIYGIAY